MLIQVIRHTHRLRILRGNKHRTCLAVDSPSFGSISELNFTALIETCFSCLSLESISHSCGDRLTLKLCEIQQIVPHHTPFLSLRIERLRERIDGHTIAVKLVRDIEILTHITAKTVILFHDNSADKSLSGIAHHLHKCGTVHHIFSRLAVIAIDTIIAFSHKSDTLLLLCGNGQAVVALILVADGAAYINCRDTVVCFRCSFHC